MRAPGHLGPSLARELAQRIANARFCVYPSDDPVGAAIGGVSAVVTARNPAGLTLGAAAHEMLDGIWASLFAGLEPCAGVVARRTAEIRPA